MRIAVAGGTGVVGRHLVDILNRQGHEPVVLARSTGVDLITDHGLDAALTGAHSVVDVSNVITARGRTSVTFFSTATANLLAAGRRADVAHHVALSIVGVDRVDLGYYEGKRRQEHLVLNGPIAGTVLRATQFFEFVEQVLAGVKGPVAPVPRMLSQPVAAREVALALAVLATSPTVGPAPDLAGPDQHEMVDLARTVIRTRQQRRWVLPVRLPGAAGRAMARGGLLPLSAGPRGSQTFEQWLSARPPA